MRHHLKFLKHPSLTQYLLLFPIIGLFDLKDEIKRDSIEVFTASWILYLFITAIWFLAAGITLYVIYTFHIALLIPIAIISVIAFLLVGVPRIIYKLANRKPRR
jgi:hypothetical protein